MIEVKLQIMDIPPDQEDEYGLVIQRDLAYRAPELVAQALGDLYKLYDTEVSVEVK